MGSWKTNTNVEGDGGPNIEATQKSLKLLPQGALPESVKRPRAFLRALANHGCTTSTYDRSEGSEETYILYFASHQRIQQLDRFFVILSLDQKVDYSKKTITTQFKMKSEIADKE